MKKLVSLLSLTLIVGLGNLSAQSTVQSDSMRSKNKMHKNNEMIPMYNMRQDSMMWYRRTDSNDDTHE